MNIRILLIIVGISFLSNLSAQTKEEKAKIKELEKSYMSFSNHKKFFETKRWAMVRFHIIYKVTTAMISEDVEKNNWNSLKVSTSAGAYGMLDGVTEADLEGITAQVAENFIRRMQEEAGIEILTWSNFKDNPNVQKIIDEADPENEIYSKSQGLGYAVSYDGTPIWNKVIQIVPGGKKLAKDLEANVMNLSFYVDFAQTEAEAKATISIGKRTIVDGQWGVPYTLSKEANMSVLPGVRVIPKLGSQSAFEGATDIGYSGVTGHTEVLHTFTFLENPGTETASRLTSGIPFAMEVIKQEGEVPAILQNRKNNKIEYASTFVVKTTPEKYAEAVVDATNLYFDDLITYYNLVTK
ncbi:MAG: hypothetical protein RIC35_23910 [Marinoscillum sp.]